MPFVHDDWWYLSEILYRGSDDNSHHSTIYGLFKSILYHYSIDNSRLCNTIASIFLLLPKWVSAIVTSISVLSGYFLMTRLSNIKSGEYVKLIFMSFLFVFMILWQDHMFTVIYQFNYIVILPLFLIAVYTFSDKLNYPLWVAVLLGLIGGSWHESYGLTILIGGGLILFLNGKSYSKLRLTLWASTAFGMMWIFIFPGPYRRLGFSTFIPLFILVAAIILVMVFIAFIRKKKLEVNLSPLNVFTLVSGLLLVPIALFLHIPRIFMPFLFLFVCVATIYVSRLFPMAMNGKKWVGRIAAVVMFAAIAVHLTAVCIDTVKLRRSVDDLVTKAFENKYTGETVFFDAHLPKDYSVFSLNRPDYNFFEYAFFLPNYVHNRELKNFVPIELKSYREEKGIPIEGIETIKLWNGHLISSDIYDKWRGDIILQFKLWKEKCKTNTSEFIGADGKTYVYIYPRRSMFTSMLGQPVGAYYE